ncbi:MAG: 2-dehydropantoate 2-reductase [Elusimicrobiota bacterium]|nr:2-dehydropantoate 2-reductase [Elusimicrobiota bacterium]
MKIAIMGAGAMGGLFGGMLIRAGQDVWLIDKHKQRAEKINREGLIIEASKALESREAKQETIRIKATTDPQEVGPCDSVILFVKAYDTEEATRNSLPLTGKRTVWLTLQNGLGNIERMSKIVGKGRVVGGITYQGATVLDMGRIRHAGCGKTVMGEIDGKESERIKSISDVFNQAGIETEISDNIEGVLWDKLLVNAVINPLTAIARVKNGQLLESPLLKETMKLIVEEAVRVPLKKGIRLPYEKVFEKVEESCFASRDNISSMLQDILRKKRTEVDFINGAIVSEAEKIGISTPLNRALWNLVKFLEGRTEYVK